VMPWIKNCLDEEFKEGSKVRDLRGEEVCEMLHSGIRIANAATQQEFYLI
jgi:hypothetical protein